MYTKTKSSAATIKMTKNMQAKKNVSFLREREAKNIMHTVKNRIAYLA